MANRKWAGKVQFVGVAWYGNDQSFNAFVDKYSLTFPQVSDNPGTVFARFGIPGQPAMVIIDPAGKVDTLLGALDESKLDEVLGAATA